MVINHRNSPASFREINLRFEDSLPIMASLELSNINCNRSVETNEKLQRLIFTLKEYDKWLYNKNKTQMLYDTLTQKIESFNTKTTLNDYHDIKQMDYNTKMDHVPCSRSIHKCICFNRHRRDNHKQYQQIYYTTDIKEILLQKLMDQIHLYLYHSSSDQRNMRIISGSNRFGTKIDQKLFRHDGKSRETMHHGRQDPVEEEKHANPRSDENIKEGDPLKSSIMTLHPTSVNHYGRSRGKHTNIASNDYDDINEDDTLNSSVIVDFDVDLEKDAYNFGQNFWYWKYYANNHWFVKPKYKNLKQELLNNKIYNIEKFDWNLENENATEKMKNDDRVKLLVSNGEFKQKYRIKGNQKITKNHLLSILFYCNTDELQREFSATYRRLEHVFESDEEFKKRHGHYYYFGKLLRETVEVYGNVMVDDKLVLFHGISHPLFFEKMIAKFYCPTSTSQDRMIAARFAGI